MSRICNHLQFSARGRFWYFGLGSQIYWGFWFLAHRSHRLTWWAYCIYSNKITPLNSGISTFFLIGCTLILSSPAYSCLTSFDKKYDHFILLCKQMDIFLGKLYIISSPERKAHRWAYNIGRHLLSVRRCRSSVVNIFKRHLLWSHEADSCHILHIASIGRGNEKCCFLSKSDKNFGCYGNI